MSENIVRTPPDGIFWIRACNVSVPSDSWIQCLYTVFVLGFKDRKIHNFISPDDNGAEKFKSYPANIFCPKNVCFCVCCIYSSSLQII